MTLARLRESEPSLQLHVLLFLHQLLRLHVTPTPADKQQQRPPFASSSLLHPIATAISGKGGLAASTNAWLSPCTGWERLFGSSFFCGGGVEVERSWARLGRSRDPA